MFPLRSFTIRHEPQPQSRGDLPYRAISFRSHQRRLPVTTPLRRIAQLCNIFLPIHLHIYSAPTIQNDVSQAVKYVDDIEHNSQQQDIYTDSEIRQSPKSRARAIPTSRYSLLITTLHDMYRSSACQLQWEVRGSGTLSYAKRDEECTTRALPGS
jgi:hypothetical protein